MKNHASRYCIKQWWICVKSNLWEHTLMQFEPQYNVFDNMNFWSEYYILKNVLFVQGFNCYISIVLQLPLVTELFSERCGHVTIISKPLLFFLSKHHTYIIASNHEVISALAAIALISSHTNCMYNLASTYNRKSVDSFTIPLRSPNDRQCQLLGPCKGTVIGIWKKGGNSHRSRERIMQWGTRQSQSIFRPTNHKSVMPTNWRQYSIPHGQSYC